MAEKLTIMLVDDHYLVRVGLASVIALEADMTVCAEASTGEHAIGLFRARRPTVTLMDLRLPGLSGLKTTEARRAEFPGARIVDLSAHASAEDVYATLEAGASAGEGESVRA